MDVQADERGLRPDPSVTPAGDRPPTGGQGELFGDVYPTFPETDKIPAVRGGGSPSGSARWLRVTVVLVALAVVAAGAALGLVKSGVISKGSGSGSDATPPAHHQTAPAAGTPLVSAVSTGAGSATYRIDIAAYAVTVTTSTGRSWVSIGATGQRPAFEGIMAPASSQKAILLGSSEVDIGAGGTKLIVTSGKRSVTLVPPSAPFTYQFTPKS
jgi:hypothetical protein